MSNCSNVTVYEAPWGYSFWTLFSDSTFILEDSQNYMPPIVAPSSAKRIALQIVVIAKLNGKKDVILRGFVCDITHTSKELSIQS